MASLYDQLARHQIYLEGVKHWQADDFNQTLDVVRDRVGTLILNSTSGGIGEMSARDYRAFERRVSDQLDRTLSRSRSIMLADLRRTSDANNGILRSIYGARTTRRKLPTDGAIWSSARRRVLGATGTTMEKLIDNYYRSMKANVLAELRKARTNNATARELFNIFRGTREANFKNGLLRKFRNQANTVISTALQHVSSVAQSLYSSIFSDRYRWVSVIDAVTTDICRGRHGKIYYHGRGPLPPAHYGCRSTTEPYDGTDTTNRPDNYFEWLQEQPLDFLADIVGIDRANALKKGTAKKVDYPQFNDVKQLPIDQFESKLKFIQAD